MYIITIEHIKPKTNNKILNLHKKQCFEKIRQKLSFFVFLLVKQHIHTLLHSVITVVTKGSDKNKKPNVRSAASSFNILTSS